MLTETRPAALPGPSGRKYLLAVLALALCFQITIIARSPFVNPDGVTFIRIAQGFWENPRVKIVQSDQHPGYPVLIPVGHWIAGWFVQDREVAAWIVGARLVTGVFGLLLLLPLWGLTRRLFDTRTAVVTLLLVAALPLFRRNAADAMSDSPHLFFYLLAAWCGCEGLLRRRWEWFLGAGAASGLAYWIRPEGLSVAIVLALLLALRAIGGKERGFYLAAFCALLIAASLVTAPYIAIKGKFTGKKDATTLLNIADEATPATTALENDSRAGLPTPSAPTTTHRPTLSRLPGILRDMVARISERLAHAFRYYLIVPMFVGLCMAFGKNARSEGRTAILALAAFHLALMIALYVMAGYMGERHLMPLVALLMPWTAAGALYMADWAMPRIARAVAVNRRFGSLGSAAIVGLLFACPLVPRTVATIHDSDRNYATVRAGEWIRAHAAPGDSVLSNTRSAAFYAATKWRTFNGQLPKFQTAEGRLTHRFVLLDPNGESYKSEWLEQFLPFYDIAPFGEKEGNKTRLIILSAKAPVGADNSL